MGERTRRGRAVFVEDVTKEEEEEEEEEDDEEEDERMMRRQKREMRRTRRRRTTRMSAMGEERHDKETSAGEKEAARTGDGSAERAD